MLRCAPLAVLVWLCACSSPEDKVRHGTVTAGACSVCPADGGLFDDQCASIGETTYFCVGDADGGVCATGTCMHGCGSGFDCPYNQECLPQHTLWGDVSVCVRVP